MCRHDLYMILENEKLIYNTIFFICMLYLTFNANFYMLAWSVFPWKWSLYSLARWVYLLLAGMIFTHVGMILYQWECILYPHTTGVMCISTGMICIPVGAIGNPIPTSHQLPHRFHSWDAIYFGTVIEYLHSGNWRMVTNNLTVVMMHYRTSLM